MRLSEMLVYADIKQLNEIAKSYECHCNSNSKHELIQSILSHSYREDILVNQMNKMSNEQKHFLSLLVFDKHKKYSHEELKAKIKYCKIVQLPTEKSEKKEKKRKSVKECTLSIEEKMIQQLKNEGWIFKEETQSYYSLYQIPEDKKIQFRTQMAQEFKQSLASYDDVTLVRDETGYIADDIVLLLQYFRKNAIPLNEITLMNKRIVQQLLQHFRVNEELPGKHAWKFGYGKKFGEYPDRFALLYQYCVHRQWIQELDTIVVTELGEQIVSKELNIQYEKLIEYWLTIYKKPIPNIMAICYLLYDAIDQWRLVTEIQNEIKPYIKAFYFDNEEAILHKRILKMLLHFGVIQLGQTENQQLLIRFSNYGKKWLALALNLSEKH